eukprot:COSAG02_NODE_6982_length_3249_cov_1.873968_4_plen_123_part_00
MRICPWSVPVPRLRGRCIVHGVASAGVGSYASPPEYARAVAPAAGASRMFVYRARGSGRIARPPPGSLREASGRRSARLEAPPAGLQPFRSHFAAAESSEEASVQLGAESSDLSATLRCIDG